MEQMYGIFAILVSINLLLVLREIIRQRGWKIPLPSFRLASVEPVAARLEHRTEPTF